jgi:hypothetical protein
VDETHHHAQVSNQIPPAHLHLNQSVTHHNTLIHVYILCNLLKQRYSSHQFSHNYRPNHSSSHTVLSRCKNMFISLGITQSVQELCYRLDDLGLEILFSKMSRGHWDQPNIHSIATYTLSPEGKSAGE